MKTLSQLLKDESDVLERAASYEKTLGLLNSAQREIATLTPQVEHYRQQIALLDDVAAKARLIDPGIAGRESYEARGIIIAHVAAAQEFAGARIAKIEAKLAVYTNDLPRLQASVQTLSN